MMKNLLPATADLWSISRKFLVLAIFGAFCACQPAKPSAQDELETKARELFEAFNRHDWKAMSEFYAPDAEFLDPSLGVEYVRQSREDIIRKYGGMASVFPNIRDEIVGIYRSGDKVIVEFISSGDGVEGAPSFRLPIISVLTFREGLIIKDATYYDN